MTARLGVDIGGTFTDFLLLDDEGNTQIVKVPTDHVDPGGVIRVGLEELAAQRNVVLEQLLGEIHVIIHGTTVVTNALIQRKGARVGLLCTDGFRDSLEIRQGYKEERYDMTYPPPPVLVPRYLRIGVRERVDKYGKVLVPLNEDDVWAAIGMFEENQVEAIAVSYLWSFLNPAHELRTAEIVSTALPETFVCRSSEVLPQIREYDRTSTTVINAFAGPALRGYIVKIEKMLEDLGYRGDVRFMQANAGFARGEYLARKPVYALNSGPSAAPTAAAFFGQAIGAGDVISVDAGGTSFDVCLVRNGLADTVRNIDVHRYRVGIPMINVHTIGAGGGSIARVDQGGILRVGPDSAQAEPGPACYGRGGDAPTVTDAAFILGYLPREGLVGGKVQLSESAARQAIRRHIADELEMTDEEAAHGIIEVVTHAMVDGIREVSIERGFDARDFALVVGGGSGALNACRLAEELAIKTVVVPRVASALCAFGAAIAQPRYDLHASYAVRLQEADARRIDLLYTDMEAQCRAELAREGRETHVDLTRFMELRYLGQVHECTIQVGEEPLDERRQEIEEAFHARHEALYGYAEREHGVCELINLSVIGTGEVPTAVKTLAAVDGQAHEHGKPEMRRAFFPQAGGWCDVDVWKGGRIGTARTVEGPAIIEEVTTTIVVFPGWSAKLDERGFFVMQPASRDGEYVDQAMSEARAEGATSV